MKSSSAAVSGSASASPSVLTQSHGAGQRHLSVMSENHLDSLPADY